MRLGAFDFLQKPFAPEVVRLKVERALELRGERRAARARRGRERGAARRRRRAVPLRRDRRRDAGDARACSQTIEKVAPTDASVYIHGESGTGKELVARAIHARSKRAQRAVRQGQLRRADRDAARGELFGHEKGAFTGAIKRKLGRFELADKGTLFLDEIGDVTPALQVKLLRVLQEREFERVGGEETIKVDVRVAVGDPPGPRGRGRGRAVPRGSLLPPARRARARCRRCASARRTSRSWSRTSSPSSARAPTRRVARHRRRRARRGSCAYQLAGQRARARERHRAGAGVRRGRRPSTSARCRRSCGAALPENALALPARRDVAARDPRGSRAPADPARLRQERRREDRDRAPARHQDQRALLQAREVRHRHHREPRRQGGAAGASPKRCSTTLLDDGPPGGGGGGRDRAR